MEWLDGKRLAKEIYGELRQSIEQRQAQVGRAPRFELLLVGDRTDSLTYVRHKVRACERIGIEARIRQFPEDVQEADLLDAIQALNRDAAVDALLLQTPLPASLREAVATAAIAPEKDVDVFHPQNLGLLMQGRAHLLPPTPAGVVELLKRYEIPLAGKHCVVIGRSQLVGRPLSVLLSEKSSRGNATVSVCHAATSPQLLAQLCREADVLIAAAGQPGLVEGSMVKAGAAVIDAGSTWVPDPRKQSGFRVEGDVDQASVAAKAAFLTPVPGGVGPMTVAMLLRNVYLAFERRHLAR